jgi:hypothetical protein
MTSPAEQPIGHPESQHGHNQELKQQGFVQVKSLVA